MDKVLLLSNEVFHYREKIYNYFYDRFSKDGFEFHVASNRFQDSWEHCFVEHRMPSLREWKRVLEEVEPTVVIMFLHLKDGIFFPLIRYCKKHEIKVIYWGTGISWSDPDNKVKLLLYRLIHGSCDALVTYSPKTVSLFRENVREKLFVAPNTLNLVDVDKQGYDKEKTKRKYRIKEKLVVLMMTRMTQVRQPRILVKALAGVADVAVVLVGPGADDELLEVIKEAGNAYYLGPKYGTEAYELLNMADVYSSPKTIGLGLNEAYYWGLPVVVMNSKSHGAESYYLKGGQTCFIADDDESYKDALCTLLFDEEIRREMSSNCLDTYEKEMSIDRMYEGFLAAIRYATE